MSIRVNKNNTIYVLILTGIVFTFSVCMSLLYRVPVLSNGVPFFAFFIVGMLLPGYALTHVLKIKIQTNVELLAYSLFLGYLLTFVEYFLCVPWGLKKYAWVFGVIVAVVSIIYLVVASKKNILAQDFIDDKFGIKIIFSFIVILLVFESITYAGCNALPIAIKESYFEPDPLFWVRNTVRFYREFKIYSPYHWFTSAQLAFVSLATGIRPIVLSFAFEFIIPVFMMVMGAYLVFSRLTGNKRLIVLAIFCLFFTFGSSDLAVVDYSSLLIEPFALDYGMGLFLFVMYLMIKELEKVETSYNDFFVMIFLFALLCGAKANYAAIATVGIGFCCIKWFCNKQVKRSVFVGLPVLVTFVLSYIFITNMSGYTKNEHGVEATTLDNFVIPAIYNSDEKNVYNFAMGLPFGGVLNHILFVVLFLLACHPFLFSTIFFQIGRTIYKKQKLAEGSMIILGLIFVCVFIRMVIGMNGNTEEYFFVNAIPLCISFVILNWKDNAIDRKKCVFKLSIVCVLVAISFVGWTTEHYRFQVYRTLKTGLKNICGISQEYDAHSKWVRKGYLNTEEMESLEWIRDNLSEKECFATNNEFRIVECVSERLPVLYGEFKTVALGEEEEKFLVDKIVSDQIKYIYYDKVIEGMSDYIFRDDRLSIVFENNDTVVYSID